MLQPLPSHPGQQIGAVLAVLAGVTEEMHAGNSEVSPKQTGEFAPC